MSPASKPPQKPSLEALLQLKRSERPDADFWAEFDRGVKQKQLAAIVEPKPWWLGYRFAFQQFSPFATVGLAAGAAVFVVIALSSATRDSFSSSPTTPAVVASVQSADGGLSLSTVEPTKLATKDLVAARVSAPLPAISGAAEAVFERSPTGKDVSTAPAPTSGVKRQANMAATTSIVSATIEAPQTRAKLAEKGTAVAAAAPATISAQTGEGVSMGDFSTDVLALDKAPSEVVGSGESAGRAAGEAEMPFATAKQARLLALADEAEAAESLPWEQVRDRVIHRISEGEALYASISRLGVSADRLSLKF